jgi:TolB-like protein/DNA-binding winged helix-turn-helix (wHTH) protein
VAVARGPALRFGDFVLDPQRYELRRGTGPVRLQPKTFDLLLHLLQHPDRVLDKEELLAAVWPGVVVTEHSLTRAVKDLRRALDDDAAAPRYIETVARRGYRFMLRPQPLEAAGAAAPELHAPEEPEEPGGRPRPSAPPMPPMPAMPALSPVPAVPVVPPAPARRWPLPDLWALLLGVAVLAALGLGWALSRSAGWPAPAVPAASVAVLPFANLTPPGQGDEALAQTLADGVAEDLLDRLAQLPRLQVVARTSSFAFREQAQDVKRIGRTLGVAWVLEGSVRTDGQRVRVGAQLVDTRSGFRAWSVRLERPLADLFALQDEIARSVAVQVVQHIEPGSALPDAHRSAGVQAWREFMLARELFNRRTQDWRAPARAALQRALALEPDFARALALLAIVDLLEAEHAGDRDAWVRGAEAALRRALAADPRLGLAHAAQGLLHLQRNEPARADAALARAVELDPQLAAAYNWRHIVLNQLGRAAEAQAVLAQALQIDPLNPTLRGNLASALEREGRYDAARQELLRLMELPARPQGATASLRAMDLDWGRLAPALRWALQLERDAAANWGPQAAVPLLPVLARLELAEPLAPRLAALQGQVLPVAVLRRMDETLLRLGRLEESEAWARALLASQPRPPQRFWAVRATSLALRGRLEEALAAQAAHAREPVREGLRELADMTSALAWARLRQGDAGQQRLARADLARLLAQGEAGELGRSPQARAEQAMHRALAGQVEAALQQLEAAQRDGFNDHLWLRHDPRWGALQGEPRFVAVQQAAARSAAAERAAVLRLAAGDPGYATLRPGPAPTPP